MGSFLDMQPLIHLAHSYTFNGSITEGWRIGHRYAFHLFAKGAGAVMIENRRHPVDVGSLIFIPPGKKHRFEFAASAHLISYNIYCDLWLSDRGERPLFTLVEDRFLRALSPPVPGDRERPPLSEETQLALHSPLYDGFLHIVDLVGRNIDYKATITNGLLYCWVLQLVQHAKLYQPKDRRIRRLLASIDELEHLPRCEDLPQLYGLKKTQFYTLFKRETGYSPKEYLLKVKMGKARAYLLESSASVTEIAEMLGYTSIHYFSAQFRSWFGVTPTAFRQQNLSETADNTEQNHKDSRPLPRLK